MGPTRNIGIIAHIDAGKTTVSERFLFYSGREYRIGEVHEGTAHMDWLVEEQERGITITSAATTFEWAGARINLIDTPGHVDFTAEVERSLRVLDGAIGVFCGVAGVEAQSETVWRQADKYSVPRIAFVNKLDRIGSDFFRVLEEIAVEFRCICLPVIVPVGTEGDFRAIVDLVRMRQLSFDAESLGQKVIEEEIDPSVAETAEMYRELLLERVADHSDRVMEKVLEGEPVPVELLEREIRRGTLDRHWVPVLGGSAFKNKGIQPLLDAVVAYLPDPSDLDHVVGHDLRTGNKLTRALVADEPFAALVFKVQIDSHGEIFYLRIYSGKIAKGQACLNPRTGKKERIGNLYRMHAGDREIIEQAVAGDIVAVMGLRFSGTGDTLCDQGKPIILENVVFPETVISIAIEPKSSTDRDRLQDQLERLTKEDPTFRIHVNDDGQFIISGMGELHLEVIRNRLVRDFKIDANVGKPRVSYRQTLSSVVRKKIHFERQLGGKDHHGGIELEAHPDRELTGSEVDWIDAGDVPAGWRKGIEEAVQGCVASGGAFGVPYIQVRVGIRIPPITPQTTEIGIAMACRECFDAIEKIAGAVLLEPVMRFEINTPEEYFGAIHQDLIRRRATIDGVEQLPGGLRRLGGVVPLNEVFGYTTSIRSLSQGRASLSLEPIGFQEAPEADAERFRF